MTFTKVRGRGVTTTDNYTVGVITATKFVGPITGGGGDIQVGVLTTTQLDLNGNGDVSGNLVVHGNLTANGDFTTLNTTLREVELLHVDTNSSATAGIITQRGSGDILNLFDTTTEVMTVVNGGFVGIGTNIPAKGLEVTSNTTPQFQVGMKNSSARASLMHNGSHLYFDTTTGDQVFRTGSTSEKVRITSTGKIGIGSAVPTNSLDINAAAGVGIRLRNATTNNSVYFTSEASDKIQFNVGGGTGSYAWIAAGAEKLTLTTAGNLGINTTVPAEKLSVAVPGSQRQNIAKFEHIGQQNFFIQGQWGSTDIGGANGTLLYGSGTVALRAATSGNAHLVNLANGNIGIGNNDPDGKLHVQNSTAGSVSAASDANELILESAANVGMSFLTANDSLSRIKFGDTTATNRGIFYFNHSTTSFNFQYTSSLKLTIDSSGNIIPGAAGTQNLGSTAKEWGDVFLASDKALKLGNSQIGDLYVGSDNVTYLRNSTGQMVIRAAGDIYISDYSGNHRAGFRDNSSVDLYYDVENNATAKLSTTAKGISVHGEVAASQDYPNYRPTLDLNFAAVKKLDPRITYRRTGPASYTDEFGKVVLVGDNAPRFDHDPITRESIGLLLEESRTNMFWGTRNIGSSGRWAVGGARGSQGANVEGPDGTLTALQNVYNGTSGDLNIYYTPGVITTSNSTVYTCSVFAKAEPGNSYINGIRLRTYGPERSVSYNVINGTVGASNEGSSSILSKTIEEYPNGWYRCIMTFTSGTDGNQGFQIYVENEGGDNAGLNNSSANGEAMYFWGAQLEQGSFVTSYIPTPSLAAATRGLDLTTIEGTEFSDVFDTDFKQFSMVADYDNTTTPDGTSYGIIDLWGESTGYDDRVEWFKDNASPYHIETRSFGQGNATFANGNLSASSKAKSQRFATSWYVPDYSNTSSRRFVVSMGGEAVDVIGDNSGTTVPQLTRMGIGCNPTRLDFSGGVLHFKRLMLYNRTLSDGQLQNLSAQ